MPPKKGKGKGKKAKKIKEIDYAADAIFDPTRSIIYIEHTNECPIFQMKAEEFLTFLQTQIEERQFVLIRNKFGKVPPREGAFEIGFSQNARTSVHDLWSGRERGPPRRDKFPPDYALLLPEVRKVLKKFYPDLTAMHDDVDDYDDVAGGEANA